jgi:hypothetical protein
VSSGLPLYVTPEPGGGGGGGGDADGVSSVSIAGSGNHTLSSGESNATLIVLTGARTGDAVVTLDNQAGRTWLVCNKTTGPYLVKILGPSGGASYLGPGQTKALAVDADGVLQGDGLEVWRATFDLSLIRSGGPGPYDTILCKLPPRIRLAPPLAAVQAVVAGGPAVWRLGTTSGGAELIAEATMDSSSPGLDDVYGNLAAQLGSAVDDGGAYYYAAAQSVHFGEHPSAVVTAGAIRLRLLGEVL